MTVAGHVDGVRTKRVSGSKPGNGRIDRQVGGQTAVYANVKA